MAARVAPVSGIRPMNALLNGGPSSKGGFPPGGSDSPDRLETKVDVSRIEETIRSGGASISPPITELTEPLLGRSRGAAGGGGTTIIGTPVVGGGTFSVAHQQLQSYEEAEQQQQQQQAAAATSSGIDLTMTTLQCLGIGFRLAAKATALGVYAMLLLPGHLQVMWYYFSCKSVLRNIPYGDQPRNLLDLYLPETTTEAGRPVVIFVAGGAWMIGNKAWGALFARRLAERDVLVASVDYRNFPRATVSAMVEDVSQAIAFVLRNAHSYGGDVSRVFLVGQSAGAHLAACALVRQAQREAAAAGAAAAGESEWQPSRLAAFIGISGLYDLTAVVDHFRRRGLHPALLCRLMEGEASLPAFSPERTVARPEFRTALCFLPPVHLFHGAADVSVPAHSSASFATVLQSLACEVTVTVYPDKTHTDMIVQDWMRGGRDELQDDILAIVRPGEAVSLTDARLVPEFLIQLARRLSPF